MERRSESEYAILSLQGEPEQRKRVDSTDLAGSSAAMQQLHFSSEEESRTHKVLADVVEVFAVLLQRLLEQHGLGGAPLLHLIPAQHRPALGHQAGHGLGQVVAVLLQGVHGVELVVETQGLSASASAAASHTHRQTRTSVMSLEAAAALMWRLGWRMELLQSRARANVPTALQHKQGDTTDISERENTAVGLDKFIRNKISFHVFFFVFFFYFKFSGHTLKQTEN